METAAENNLPPGSAKLVANIMNYLKAQGIFDQFRHDCLADVDTKPSYQNLRQRFDGFVSKFLANETWSPEMNKNQLRNDLRRQIDESGMLALGVEHVVEQVVTAKMYQVFLPKIEVIVREYLSKVEEQREEVPIDKRHDTVDGTTKEPKSAANDKPGEIIKEVTTAESLAKPQKFKEEPCGNHESLKPDRLIRPDVEKNATEKRAGAPDRAADVKQSTHQHNSDSKLIENPERKEFLDVRKTPDGKSENRKVNSKFHLDVGKNKPEIDVIRRLDKSWLKQREKARLKYEEPVVESPEKSTHSRDETSPEKNRTSMQNDSSSKYSPSAKNKRYEDSANFRGRENSSKHKMSMSKSHRSRTKTDSVDESKHESKHGTSSNSKASKSNDVWSSDSGKNTSNDGYKNEVRYSSSGSFQSPSKSTEARNKETSKNSKAKVDYGRSRSSKSESRFKSHKYSYDTGSFSNKPKSEKRNSSDSSKKVETPSKHQISKSHTPKKEKDDKNKYLKKEISAEQKLLEYNQLLYQKTFHDAKPLQRESSISSQGSCQDARNDYNAKYKNKYESKTRSHSADVNSKSKITSDTRSNHKIKTKVNYDFPEFTKKSDFKNMSPVDLNEGKSSSNSSTRESLFASSESDNFEESGQSSGSSVNAERQKKEGCSDGRRCNTPPLSRSQGKKSKRDAGRSYHNNSDSITKRVNESPSSQTKTECGSSDTVSNSLNDSMFLSSASSSSDESFLSRQDVEERHRKSQRKSRSMCGDESAGEWSHVSISSVHTSDLSSFDDQISLSSSDEEHTHKTRKGRKKKKKKKKLSLKEVKLIAEEIDDDTDEESAKRKLQSKELKREKIKETFLKADVSGQSDSRDSSSSSDDDVRNAHWADSSKKNCRKRKRNAKYASNEYSLYFTPSKKADTRRSADRNLSNLDGCSSEVHEGSTTDLTKAGNTILDIMKKSISKKFTGASEAKSEADSKSKSVSSQMDVHSGVYSGQNDSSSDFSDIISDDLSSDDEKTVQNNPVVEIETCNDRKSSLEDSDSSDDETFNEKMHQKRKYMDSSESKIHVSNESVSNKSSGLRNCGDIRSFENGSNGHQMHSSDTSLPQLKCDQEENGYDADGSKADIISPGEETVPKKRGRPRKNLVPDVSVAKSNRKRGRPRKQPSNDDGRSNINDTSAFQKRNSLHSYETANTENKGRQLRRDSEERTATRSSRRLSTGNEEQVTRPLRRFSEHSQNSCDQYKNDSQHRSDFQHSSKWYDSSDLYKPRRNISSSSRRSRSHLQL